jgi:hypothetical protein
MGAASPISGGPFAIGDVVINPQPDGLPSDLFSHEAKHSYQWGALGWGFPAAYGIARAVQGECNVFEGQAGFESGGYHRCG